MRFEINKQKKHVITILLVTCFFFSVAQKRDYNWCFGDSVGINFNTLIPTVFQSSINTHECSASISDNNGNLLFYIGSKTSNSYNLTIWNKNHTVMINGDSLSGHPSVTMGALIIPFYSDTTKYFIFHIQAIFGYYLFYSVVNISQDNGNGAVISKNNLLYNGSNITEKLIAVKHANGRDWWIIFHKQGNNEFVKYLIANDNITGPFYQAIGSVNSSSYGGKMGEMEVSSNGDKIITTNLLGVVDLFDFNRCTGILSNWNDLGFNYFIQYSGCAFSDKGDRLYVSQLDSLFQFDLLATDILSSKQLIWATSSQHDWHLGQLQLSPDKKIFLANISGQAFPNNNFDTANMNLSVINNPEGIGLACDFQPYSFSLSGRRSFLGLPNMPNYNLGALEGSVCDTLTTVESEKLKVESEKLVVSPNPAKDILNIEQGNNEPVEILIYDIQGMLCKADLLKNKSQQIDISGLSQGVYILKLVSQKSTLVRKIIKE